MKSSLALRLGFALCAVACTPLAFADTVVFSSGRTMDGTVVRTNGNDVLVVADCAAFNFSRESIKEIRTEHVEVVEVNNTNRLAPFRLALARLAKQAWASDLRPIPATVVDKGMLRNVPYMSFRCGDDYEVNIYGEPEHPAGLEVGVYHKLLEDPSAKKNCIALVAELLGRPDDREVLRGLNMEKDVKTKEALTFEITPPSAEDAYMGWWVSIYSERSLDAARASDDEMKRISVPKVEAEREARTGDPTSWSAQDLKLARQTLPKTITFMTQSGSVVSNAEVVRVNEGVSLVWRDGASGGVVNLADLPEDLRTRFGYDADKARAVDALEEGRKVREREQAQNVAAAAAVQAQAVAPPTYQFDNYSGSSLSSSRSYGSKSLSTGGSVYVRGYTRKNGTYVQSHTRSARRSRR